MKSSKDSNWFSEASFCLELNPKLDAAAASVQGTSAELRTNGIDFGICSAPADITTTAMECLNCKDLFVNKPA